MSILIGCHCGIQLMVEPHLAGQTVQCAHCGQLLQVPQSVAPSIPVATVAQPSTVQPQVDQSSIIADKPGLPGRKKLDTPILVGLIAFPILLVLVVVIVLVSGKKREDKHRTVRLPGNIEVRVPDMSKMRNAPDVNKIIKQVDSMTGRLRKSLPQQARNRVPFASSSSKRRQQKKPPASNPDRHKVVRPGPTDADRFSRIFDGKSLRGWRVEPESREGVWQARGGSVVASGNGVVSSMLVWNGGELRDFEVKLEYRFTEGGNAGIHIRAQWAKNSRHRRLISYEADLSRHDHGTRVTGAWKFDGAPRVAGGLLARRGRRAVISSNGRVSSSRIPNSLDSKDIDAKGWNQVHIVARGNEFRYSINNRISSELVDKETAKRHDRGLFGLSIASGSGTTVEYRNIRLKRN